MKTYYVYILASKNNGTLYIGITSNLAKRIWEHKTKVIIGFTARYNVNRLVYFELHHDVSKAIEREKRLKEWPRKWKIDLVNSTNPDWADLYPGIV